MNFTNEINFNNAMEPQSAEECFRMAVNFQAKKDRANYELYAKKAAELGSVDAMYSLGEAYELGFIEPDINKALYWYGRACELGNSTATFRIANIYDDSRYSIADPKRALEYYMRAADMGDTNSIYYKGLLYAGLNPNVKLYDLSVARKCILQAAEAGNIPAMHAVAYCYWQADFGFSKDLEKAEFWLQKLLEQPPMENTLNNKEFYQDFHAKAREALPRLQKERKKKKWLFW